MRFGKNNIALHRKARRYAACCGVCQHGDIQQPCVTVFFHSAAGLCHLHQRQNTLLHSCAARNGKNDHRQTVRCGILKRSRDLFARHRTHRAHHELRVHHSDHGFFAVDLANARDDRFIFAAAEFCAPELFLIIGKSDLINRRHISVHFGKCSLVHRHFNALSGGDAEMIAAFRTNLVVVHQIGRKHRIFAHRTLDPEFFGNVRMILCKSTLIFQLIFRFQKIKNIRQFIHLTYPSLIV